MKKIIALLLTTIIFVFMLSSCGNMGLGPGKFTFKKVHITTYSGEDRCCTIEKWYDNEEGIEVKTKEYGALFLSEGTYILCADKCPICD